MSLLPTLIADTHCHLNEFAALARHCRESTDCLLNKLAALEQRGRESASAIALVVMTLADKRHCYTAAEHAAVSTGRSLANAMASGDNTEADKGTKALATKASRAAEELWGLDHLQTVARQCLLNEYTAHI